jgi:hypothetical protein
MLETSDAAIPAQRSAPHIEGAVAAFHRTWAAMVTACSAGSYASRDGAAEARTGLPAAPFNGVWGLTTDVSAPAVLAAVDRFAAGDLPWNVQLRPGFSDALADALAERGLVKTAAIPFMVQLEAPALGDAPPAMRKLDTFADLDSMISLLEQGFGMPPELTRQSFSLQMLFVPGATTWLARQDDVDVSTGFGCVDGEYVGVFNVATPEAFRGRGHGGAVTQQAVLAGLSAGASVAYLQSSPMGYSVYQRLGFETVEHWQQWMPAAYLD